MNQTLSNQYDFLPRFFRLAIANVISNIMVPLANLVSVAFLGHLPEVRHLAGVALASNLFNAIYFVLCFLRMGTTGVTAQAVGRNDRESVVLVALRNALVALVLGIVMLSLQHPLREIAFTLESTPPEVNASAIDFFNAQIWAAPAVLLNFVLMGWFLGQEQNGKVVLSSVIGSGFNILFNYLFIIQWGWESMGAGAAYTISQYLTLLVGLIFFAIEISWQDLQAVAGKLWNWSAFKSTFTLNGDIFVSNLAFLFILLIFNYESAAMGTITYAENALLMQIFAFAAYFIEGLGFGTETLAGNFKGKAANKQLPPLLGISLGSGLLVGLIFAGVPALFPQTVFGLITNHTEVTEQIGTYVPWLLLLLGIGSLAFMLDGYFLGLAQGYSLRNASLVAIGVGFAPTVFAASEFHSNHYLWLALTLFMAIRLVMFVIQLPRTFISDIEDSSVPLANIKQESYE